MPEPQYSDYVNMIRKVAWKKIKTNPSLDFDELVSLGSLGFMQAVKSWDPNKGMFSTHLWYQLQDQMGRIKGCIKCPTEEKNTVLLEDSYGRAGHTYQNNMFSPSEEHRSSVLSSLDDLDLGIQIADDKPSPFEETKFRAGLASLSKEALEVVYLVLGSPQELVDWTIRWIRPSQSSIRTFLHSLGWKPKKIDQVFGEIKLMLKEL
jgi:hypothetical protein